jgi:hypothetical protein
MRRADCILGANALASKNAARKPRHALSKKAFSSAFPPGQEQAWISREIISVCLRAHCRQFKK